MLNIFILVYTAMVLVVFLGCLVVLDADGISVLMACGVDDDWYSWACISGLLEYWGYWMMYSIGGSFFDYWSFVVDDFVVCRL